MQQEVGCRARRAAGHSRARLRGAGCPGARAVPTHPGCSITALPFPNPPGTAQPRDATWAEPEDPHRAKSLPLPLREPPGTPSPEPALPWHRAGQGKGRAGSAAPQHRRQLQAGCPSAVIWSSDIRAGTQPRSLCPRRPQNSSASCRAWLFFLAT